MKIQGYGEFQQLRKASQKDDANRRDATDRPEGGEAEGGILSDAVSISPESRRRGKLRMASDFRQEKVADVKARLEEGALVTPEALKSGTSKMLSSLLSGEL